MSITEYRLFAYEKERVIDFLKFLKRDFSLLAEEYKKPLPKEFSSKKKEFDDEEKLVKKILSNLNELIGDISRLN
jgi:hypothetical protein